MSNRRLSILTTFCLALVGLFSVGVGSALAAAPSVTVGTPTGMTGTSVHVTGTVNPNGAPGAPPTFWGIQYARASEPGVWVGAPLGGEFAGVEAELKTPQPVEGTIEGLEPNTAYEVRVFATNEALEEANPIPEEPFSTLAIAPGLLSETATPLTPFEARLEGLVNANNQVTSCEFQYGLTTAFATHVACEPASIAGFFEQGVALTLKGLESGKTYHSRIVLENTKSETTTGTDLPFNTPPAEKPAIDSESVTELTLTSTEASLEGKVNPNYQDTHSYFQYSTSPTVDGNGSLTSATKAPGTPVDLGEGFGDVPLGPTALTGLTPGVVYYYQAVATNATGTTNGAVQSFQALDLPVPTTGEAREVTGTTATLTGTVNPAGAVTTYYFSYIDEAGYEAALGEGAPDPYAKGASTPEASTTAAYTVGPANPLAASGLQPGTTYHYALVASNSVGTVTGPDATFTTLASTPPPVAATGGALGITSGTATITGTVETQGQSTSAAFEFGSSPALGSTEGQSNLPGAAGGTPVAFAFNGYLSPGTTYYYRVIATNAQGTSYGVEQSFTTVASPSAALSPITPLLSDATVEEVKPAVTKPAPAKKCKKGTTLKKGKCTKSKAKARKKKRAKGRKSSHSGQKRGN